MSEFEFKEFYIDETKLSGQLVQVLEGTELNAGSEFNYRAAFENFVDKIHVPAEILGTISHQMLAVLWAVRFSTKGYQSTKIHETVLKIKGVKTRSSYFVYTDNKGNKVPDQVSARAEWSLIQGRNEAKARARYENQNEYSDLQQKKADKNTKLSDVEKARLKDLEKLYNTPDELQKFNRDTEEGPEKIIDVAFTLRECLRGGESLARETRDPGVATARRVAIAAAKVTRSFIDRGLIKNTTGMKRLNCPAKFGFIGFEFAIRDQSEVDEYLKYLYAQDLTNVNKVNVEAKSKRILQARGFTVRERTEDEKKNLKSKKTKEEEDEGLR